MARRSSRKSRRRGFRDPAPSSPYPLGRRLVFWGVMLSVVGMTFLYGGTRFWASSPFLFVGFCLIGFHQALSWRGVSRGGGDLRPPAGLVPALALLLYVVIRAVAGTAVVYETWTELYHLGAALLIYVVCVDLGTLRHAWPQAQLVLYVGGSLQAMYAVGLHLQDSREVLWLLRPESYGMRASGTWICPNHFAHFLQMASVVALAAFLTPKTRLYLRLVAGYALLWMVPALLLSQSRAGLLGLLVGFGVLFALKFARKGWKATLGLAGAGGVAALVGAAGVRVAFPGMYSRIVKGLKGDIRFSAFWPDTWRMIREEGVWGVGPGGFKHVFEQYRESFSHSHLYMDYAHNEVLHVLADYGWIPTGALLAGILIAMGVLTKKSLTEEEEEKAMVSLLLLALGLSSLAHAVFDFNFHIMANGLVFVMLMGLLEGLGRQKGVWTAPSVPRAWGKPLCGAGLGLSIVALAAAVLLFLGSVSEYRLDEARVRKDSEAVSVHAAAMRRWTPMYWRGWTEKGLLLRKEAFWLRDPVIKTERIGQSREAYREALKRNPYDRIALIGLVELAKMEKDPRRALEGLNRLEQQAPFDVRVRIQKGLALQKLGRLEESLQVFEEAKRLRGRPDKQIDLNLRYLRRKLKASEE